MTARARRLGGTFARQPVACAAALAILDDHGESFLPGARDRCRIDPRCRAMQSQSRKSRTFGGLGA